MNTIGNVNALSAANSAQATADSAASAASAAQSTANSAVSAASTAQSTANSAASAASAAQSTANSAASAAATAQSTANGKVTMASDSSTKDITIKTANSWTHDLWFSNSNDGMTIGSGPVSVTFNYKKITVSAPYGTRSVNLS